MPTYYGISIDFGMRKPANFDLQKFPYGELIFFRFEAPDFASAEQYVKERPVYVYHRYPDISIKYFAGPRFWKQMELFENLGDIFNSQFWQNHKDHIIFYQIEKYI